MITIVILIILATVAINAIFGESGLITSAEKGKLEQEKAEARERLSLVLADAYTEKITNKEEYDQNQFLNDFIVAREPEAYIEGSESNEISLNGHTFELNREVPELGDYIGEAENLPARISKIEYEVDEEGKTISVTVSAVRIEKVETPQYKYYIKEENGEYIEKATQAENTYTFEGLEEKNYIIKVELVGEVNENYPEGLTTYKETGVIALGEKFSEIYQTTTKYIDSEGNVAWIPGGFAVGVSDGINTVNDGLVIKDAKGNQFVWIPVADYRAMYEEVSEPITLSGVTTTTNVYSKLRGVTAGKPGSTEYREPDLLTTCDTQSQYYSILGCSSAKDMADKMVAEYTATYESIKHYGGFYIGRFELTGSVDNSSVQKGAVLSAEKAGNWYYLKKACTNVVSTKYAQSTMIYGNQYDEAIAWLKTKGYNTDTDSRSWGNYSDSTGAANISGKGSLQITGYSKAWSAQNIYDLAGNYYEWIQEASFINGRVRRGGVFMYSGSSLPASSRGASYPDYPNNDCSSRSALYVTLNTD